MTKKYSDYRDKRFYTGKKKLEIIGKFIVRPYWPKWRKRIVKEIDKRMTGAREIIFCHSYPNSIRLSLGRPLSSVGQDKLRSILAAEKCRNISVDKNGARFSRW